MDSALSSGSANLEAMDAARAYQAAMTKLLVTQLGLEQGRVLDFGAGTGSYTRAAAVARPGWEMVAMEPHVALHREIGAGVEVHTDLESIPPASLDGAFSLNVFEHIDDHVAVLAGLAAKCKPGAPIFILVPAHMSLWSPMDDLVGHVRRYSLQGLAELGASAGLRVTKQGWFDSTGFFATKVYRVAASLKLLRGPAGAINKGQVGLFDRVFSLIEPVLSKVSPGKNCWIRLERK